MNARQKIDKLILDHQKEFGFHSNFDFMNELLAEMEEERDGFASGFAEWLNPLTPSQKCTVHPPAGSGLPHGLYDKSMDALIEQYKKTL